MEESKEGESLDQFDSLKREGPKKVNFMLNQDSLPL